MHRVYTVVKYWAYGIAAFIGVYAFNGLTGWGKQGSTSPKGIGGMWQEIAVQPLRSLLILCLAGALFGFFIWIGSPKNNKKQL